MTKRDHLRALGRLCRRLGGRLAVVSDDYYYHLFDTADRCDPNTVRESPFTSGHGLHWRRRIIYTVRGHEEIGSIIHEMGHVFADPHDPDDAKCSEWTWFGWEIAVARLIGAGRQWSRDSRHYVTDGSDGTDWGSLSTSARRALAVERIAHAKKIGIVSQDGTPRSIR